MLKNRPISLTLCRFSKQFPVLQVYLGKGGTKRDTLGTLPNTYVCAPAVGRRAISAASRTRRTPMYNELPIALTDRPVGSFCRALRRHLAETSGE